MLHIILENNQYPGGVSDNWRPVFIPFFKNWCIGGERMQVTKNEPDINALGDSRIDSKETNWKYSEKCCNL